MIVSKFTTSEWPTVSLGFVAIPFPKPTPGIRFRFYIQSSLAQPVGLSFRFYGAGRKRLDDKIPGVGNDFFPSLLNFHPLTVVPRANVITRVCKALGETDLIAAERVVYDTTLPKLVKYLEFTLTPPNTDRSDGYQILRRLPDIGLGKKKRKVAYGFPLTAVQRAKLIDVANGILNRKTIDEDDKAMVLEQQFFVLLGGFCSPLIWKGHDDEC